MISSSNKIRANLRLRRIHCGALATAIRPADSGRGVSAFAKRPPATLSENGHVDWYALQDPASVAGLLVTTGAEKPQAQDPAAMPPGGGAKGDTQLFFAHELPALVALDERIADVPS